MFFEHIVHVQVRLYFFTNNIKGVVIMGNVFSSIFKALKHRFIALLINCSIKCLEQNLDCIAHGLFNTARKLANKPPIHFCKWKVIYDDYKNIIGMKCMQCNKQRNLF
jgi:hypothetical protein